MASADEACETAVIETCIIEATVPTGFESVAAEEANEQFKTECRSARGKIRFETPTERVTDILNLGGIDHCRAQILFKEYFGFTSDGDDCLTRLQLLVKECNWTDGLAIWSKFYSFSHPVATQPDVIPADEELIDVCYSKHMPGHKVHTAGGGKKTGPKDRKKGGRKGRNDRKQKKEEGEKDEAAGEESEVTQAPEECAEAEAYRPSPCESSADAAAAPENKPQHDGDAGDGIRTGVNSCQSPSKESPSKHPTSLSDLEEGLEGATSQTEETNIASGGDNDLLSPSQWPAHEDFPIKAPEPESPVKESQGESSVDPKGVDAEAHKPETGSGTDKPKQTRKPKDPTKPSFRVTCKRTGDSHSFDSMSAAASFGSAVQKYFGWNVDMTDFHIEVVLSIDNNEVSVGLALTPESLHKRNLVAFGVTTLRPTICHNMLRMVKVLPGHVVCDPMCGTGSISIQGALRFPAFQLCGDNYSVPMEKTILNKDALNAKRARTGSGGLMMDAVKWDACKLPLRDGVVDVFVSDLPFGKRMGRRYNNRKLYCDVLDEMARCGKQKGRAALLTGDINNMVKAIQGQTYWSRRRVYSCNIGGIAAAVFLLFRNPVPYTKRGEAFANQPDRSHPTCSGPNQEEAESSTLAEQERSEDDDQQGNLSTSQGGFFESPSDQGEECGSSVDKGISLLKRNGFDQFSDGADLSKPAASDTTEQKLVPTTKDNQQADDEGAGAGAAVSELGFMTSVSSSCRPTIETKMHTGEPVTEGSQPHSEPTTESSTARKPHTAVEIGAEGHGWMESSAESCVDADVKFSGIANHHHHYHHHHHHYYHHHYHVCGSPSKHPHGQRGGLHGTQDYPHHGSYDLKDSLHSTVQDRRDYTRYSNQDARDHHHHHYGSQDAREHPHSFTGHSSHQVCQDSHQASRDYSHYHPQGDKEVHQLGRKDPRIPIALVRGSHHGPGTYASSHHGTRESYGHPSHRGAYFSHSGMPFGHASRGGGNLHYRDGRHSNREGQIFGRGGSRDRGNTGRHSGDGGGGKTRKKSKDREEKENCSNIVPASRPVGGQCKPEPEHGSNNPKEIAANAGQGCGETEEARKVLNESSNKTNDGDKHESTGSRVIGQD